MLIHQRQRYLRQEADMKLKQVNLDLRILKGIQHKTMDVMGGSTQQNITSIRDLSKILKQRNKNIRATKNDRFEVRQWLQQQGINHKKLNDEIKQNSKQSLGLPLDRDRSLDRSYMFLSSYLPAHRRPNQTRFGFTEKSLNLFIEGNMGRNISRLTSLRNHEGGYGDEMDGGGSRKVRGFIKSQIKNRKLRKEHDQRIADPRMYKKRRGGLQQNSIDADENFQDQQAKYFKFVQNLSQNGFRQASEQLKSIRSFWRVIYHHIKTIEHYSGQFKQNAEDENEGSFCFNTVLMIKSLRLVEHEYEKVLPKVYNSNYEGLDKLVRKMQHESKVDIEVERDQSGEAFWGVAFLLYRAGRFEEFRRYFENSPYRHEFLQDFILHEKSFQSLKPRASVKPYPQIDDNFYSQLIYALRGEPKTIEAINQFHSLDVIWVTLRTMGVYRYNQHIETEYQEFVNKFVEFQMDSATPLSTENVQNYLYLGAYKQMLSAIQILREQQMLIKSFTQNDYFHLVLVMYYYPELYSSPCTESDRIYLERIFMKELNIYMISLQRRGLKDILPAYLLLTPSEHLEQAAIGLIKTRKDFQNFNWKELTQLLRYRDEENYKEMYNYIVKVVLDNIRVKSYQDMSFLANTYHAVLSKEENVNGEIHQIYVQSLLKMQMINVQKNMLQKYGNISEELYRRNLNEFLDLPLNENDQDIIRRAKNEAKSTLNEFQRKLEQYCQDPKHISRYEEAEMLTMSHKIDYCYSFYKESQQLLSLIEGVWQSLKQLKAFKAKWLMEDQYDEKVPYLLQFLDSYGSVDLYAHYIRALVRRETAIYDNDCNYREISSVGGKYLKAVRIMDEACQKKLAKGQFVKNPMGGCVEFEKLIQELKKRSEEEEEVLGRVGSRGSFRSM